MEDASKESSEEELKSSVGVLGLSEDVMVANSDGDESPRCRLFVAISCVLVFLRGWLWLFKTL